MPLDASPNTRSEPQAAQQAQTRSASSATSANPFDELPSLVLDQQ